MNKITVKKSLQEKKGIFQAVLYYKDLNGEKQYKWKTTGVKIVKGHKRELKEKAKEIAEKIRIDFEYGLNASLGCRDFSDRQNMLFSDYMKDWLNIMSKDKSKIKAKTTIGGYQSNVNSIICPYFEKTGIKLNELRTIDLQDFYDYQYSLGKSPSTVKHYHSNIHSALERARKTELIKKNPSNDCELAEVKKYIPNVYTKNQLKVFSQKAKSSTFEVPMLITAFLGVRRSEALGIKWNRINFDDGTITIAHAVTQPTINNKRTIVKKDLPKSDSSYRTLPMPTPLKEFLKEVKKKQEENKRSFGNCYKNDENYVCVDIEGNLIKPDAFTKGFSKFLNENNLPKIRVHDLRHTIGTLLIKNGSSLREVQEWLGHSNVQTTEIYTHLDASTKIHSVKVLNNLFKV